MISFDLDEGRTFQADAMDECLACDLTHGRRPLPGGVISARSGWWVEDCVGHRPVPTPGTAIVGVGNEPLELTHLDRPPGACSFSP